jgi:hypothetical protein
MRYKLPEKVKADWVQALRSGQYKQGREFLRVMEYSQPYFCCLGVLAETVDKGVLDRKFGDGYGEEYGVFEDEELTGNGQWCEQYGVYDVLKQYPKNWNWCGWVPPEGCVIHDRTTVEACLIHANDNGATFEQIADMVERNL